MPYNNANARQQFPSLGLTVEGNSVVFLDNPGGTQVPESVINAVSIYYRERNANMGGGFLTSNRTDETLASARSAIADLLNAPSAENIVFGANMTTLTFHIARSIADTIQHGDEIIITDLDHDANVSPWTDLQAQGAVIKSVPVTSECRLDMDSLRALINQRTKMVAVTHASNAVGTIPDVAEVVRLAHSVGALVFVDAVQFAPHGPVNVQELDCDFLACSAYKFFGPHIGILYGKAEHLTSLKPHKVRPSKDIIPFRWETGTLNFEGLAGTAAAVQYLDSLYDGVAETDRCKRLHRVMSEIKSYEMALCKELVSGLLSIPGVTVFGITDPEEFEDRLPTVAFTWDKMTPRQTAEYLAAQNIFCWSGNYYALRLMESLGLEADGGAVRIGLAHYNNSAEIDRLLGALKSA